MNITTDKEKLKAYRDAMFDMLGRDPYIQMNDMKPTNIKGKLYYPVHERVKFYRESGYYIGWRTETFVQSETSDSVAMQVKIYDSTGTIVGDGFAEEVKTAKGINSTSAWENCQTSALGRALANAGIGIDDGYASADEVQRAIQPVPKAKPKYSITWEAWRATLAALHKATDRQAILLANESLEQPLKNELERLADTLGKLDNDKDQLEALRQSSDKFKSEQL